MCITFGAVTFLIVSQYGVASMTDAEHRPAGRVPVVRDLNVRAKLTNENEAVQKLDEDKKSEKN